MLKFVVKDTRSGEYFEFSKEEYDDFIECNSLEKSKMRKTCPKLYDGNDRRNNHRGFKLEDIVEIYDIAAWSWCVNVHAMQKYHQCRCVYWRFGKGFVRRGNTKFALHDDKLNHLKNVQKNHSVL